MNKLELPPAAPSGSVPTMNQKGWMRTYSNKFYEQYFQVAAQSRDWVLEVGPAYGFHTTATIKAGGRVVAVDLEAKHLAILEAGLTPVERLNLRTICGAFPDVELPEGAFAAVLSSYCLNFVDPPTLERAAAAMLKLLQPGGKAFIAMPTPYMRSTEKIAADFDRLKAQGDKWPGFVKDMGAVDPRPEVWENMVGSMHLIDPDILAGTFKAAGFEIEAAEFVPTGKGSMFSLDNRETAFIVACKGR